MNYFAYTFIADPIHHDILTAVLSDYPFDTFQETEDALIAYVAADQNYPELQDEVLERIESLDGFCESFTLVEIPYQNWNELWESNFEPIQVGNFCGVRADFHPPFSAVKHDIIINPRMAFGTGHHETTFMMLQLMESIDFTQLRVLDFGTGTGILAILAAKEGAQYIDAVDIEEPAYENTIDNARINQVEKAVRAYLGDLSVIPDGEYDLILANINRGVILDSFPALYAKLKRGGTLLISGILQADRDIVLPQAESQGFHPDTFLEKGDWLAVRLHS
jgi:ribosomal protein L11 methyltransferase